MQEKQMLKEAEEQYYYQNFDGDVVSIDFNEGTLSDGKITLVNESNILIDLIIKDGIYPCKQLFQMLEMGQVYTYCLNAISNTEDKAKKAFIQEWFQMLVKKQLQERALNERKYLYRAIYNPVNLLLVGMKTERYTGNSGFKNLDILNKLIKEYGGHINEDLSYITPYYMSVSISNLNETELKSPRMMSAEAMQNHQKGDLVGIGFRVFNSQVGYASLGEVVELIRIACSNGMLSTEGLLFDKFKHIYKDMESFLTLGVQKSMGNVGVFLNTLQNAMDKYTCTSIDTMPKILSLCGVAKKHHEGIRKAFEIEPIGLAPDGKISDFGIYNATTYHATHGFPKQPDFTHAEQDILFGQTYKLLTV